MDRPRARASALGVILAAAGAIALAAVPEEPPIRGMRWAPRDVDPVAAFGRAPTECLTIPSDPAEALKVELGRAAFRTPVLLGGQAARAGVACDTCHRAGHTNPTFLFPGVSGAPGTADVTSSLFSTHRGDGVDNPRPIPDLSAAKSALKVDQTPGPRRLEHFIHGLVTEEFDGAEPSPAVLEGLAAYVRALDPAACSAQSGQPVTVAYFLTDVRRAVKAAEGELAAGDGPSAILALASARSRLGLIDERFAGPALKPEREAIRASDRALAQAQDSLRTHRPEAAAQLARWLDRSRALEARLTAKAPASLFDDGRLSRLGRRRLPA